jgi:hypothetical protein
MLSLNVIFFDVVLNLGGIGGLISRLVDTLLGKLCILGGWNNGAWGKHVTLGISCLTLALVGLVGLIGVFFRRHNFGKLVGANYFAGCAGAFFLAASAFSFSLFSWASRSLVISAIFERGFFTYSSALRASSAPEVVPSVLSSLVAISTNSMSTEPWGVFLFEIVQNLCQRRP